VNALIAPVRFPGLQLSFSAPVLAIQSRIQSILIVPSSGADFADFSWKNQNRIVL
jgi:hypothetical protein